jgi:hypothetical protein
MVYIISSPPFYTSYVRQPDTNNPPANILSLNRKLWPWFRSALGAIDGSHIHAHPRGKKHFLYRNRKGFYSINCLFCCTWDLLFSYALTGWEGSASDAKVYGDAFQNKGLRIEDGWYYLADAGFPHSMQMMVPYRGTRYHLAEWGQAAVR